MGKKQLVSLCSRCESPLRSQAAFCPSCGGPTPWATHDDRVAWEVRQWRATRSRDEQQGAQMMLVRTEEGLAPVRVDRTQYTWDRPLHPERPARGDNPHATAAANGRTTNGKGHVGNGHESDRAEIVHATADQPAQQADVVYEEPPQVEAPYVEPGAETERVTISKKAIAIAIALILALPLGSKLWNLTKSESETPGTAAVGSGAPSALAPIGTGFAQPYRDAARYAVVIANPNRTHAAKGVAVSVSLKDAAGRIVGRDLEQIAFVPSGGKVALAGVTGVSGPVAKLSVTISGGTFDSADRARPFAIRGVGLSQRGGDLTVRANVSGARATSGARVVVVHFDGAGRIVGGDFTYVNIPRSPRAAGAVIATSGVGRVRRVEVYILAPQ